MITIGKGGKRRVKDYALSRYACYLIIQNADPEKEIVALGQTYFAVQTRRQEVADAEILAGLNEDQRRLYLRGQLADHNRDLSEAANQAGVVTTQDFAIFHDHGYMGLYGGLRAQDIHRRKGLKRGQQILDHMGSTELAANLFRATQPRRSSAASRPRRKTARTPRTIRSGRLCGARSRNWAARCPSTSRRQRPASNSSKPRSASSAGRPGRASRCRSCRSSLMRMRTHQTKPAVHLRSSNREQVRR